MQAYSGASTSRGARATSWGGSPVEGRDILVAAGAEHILKLKEPLTLSGVQTASNRVIVAIRSRSPVAVLRFDVGGWCLSPQSSKGLGSGSRKARASPAAGQAQAPRRRRPGSAAPRGSPCGSGRGVGIAEGNGLAQSPGACPLLWVFAERL